jgi:hypothetical protein
MRLRSFVCALALALPSYAGAAPVLYTFTAVVDRSLLGASNGDIITGGLIFDDDAALISYAEYGAGADGLRTWDEPITDAIYDASDFIIFFTVGDSFLSTRGTTLRIVDSPDGAWMRGGDFWRLETELGLWFISIAFFAETLHDSALQGPPPVFVPDDSSHHSGLNWFVPGNDALLVANVTDITRVPEPATWLLMALGTTMLYRRPRT